MTAAYRLFDNEKVTPARILEPHAQRTRERIAAQPVALLVQDTTEIDLTRPEQVVCGAGPMDASDRRGAFAHVLHAFTPDRTPLGTVWSDQWARDEKSLDTPQPIRRKKRKAAPIEEKESYRWLQGLRQSQETASACPNTQCVCIADSEADIYELFAEPRSTDHPVQWLIRLGQDRPLRADPHAAGDDPQATRIREELLRSPVLFTQTISVRGRKAKVACDSRGRRQPRQDRTATVEVRAGPVRLRPPYRPGQSLPAVVVNVVWVCEVDPPDDDEPVEWLLVTTLPIETVEQVRTAIQYYCVRWMIEVYFRTLKSGCRVEQRRFETLPRMLNCLAVYMIAAWRTLLVCRMGQSCPDMNCEAVFEPAEWKAVWTAVKREPPPRTPPPLGTMVRLVAQLGGYVNRVGRTDPPGPQTVWLGLQRMRDLAWAWDLFGPGATKRLV